MWANAPPRAPADFARVFRLDDDLFLRRLVELFDTTGSGSVCLAEFLGACAHRTPHHAPTGRTPCAVDRAR